MTSPGNTNLTDSYPPPMEQPRHSGLLLGSTRWIARGLRNVLALMMLALLLMIFTPLEDQVYDWLNVTSYDTPKADAILCLGGGWGREERAAMLWHRKLAPIIVVSNKPGAAEWMRTLVQDVGVPKDRILVDRTSYTTYDHPEGIARLPGIDRERQRFIIVTDRTHSRRARDCFLKAGYKHITFWSGYKSVPKESYWGHCAWRVYTLPPLIYEAAATIKYKLQGKI